MGQMTTTFKRAAQYRRVVVRGHWYPGRCPVCAGPTVFLRLDGHPRNGLRCLRCWSLPRWRALVAVLEDRVPDWRTARIHEFAPSPASRSWFARQCPAYSCSQFWPDVAPGDERDGVRCEDLGALTFPDAGIDVVVTQDVFEHLPEPADAAREIGRVLAPGGAHVFTVPIFPKPTLVRARLNADGEIIHLEPPEFHGDPTTPDGSLVFRDWGPDIEEFLAVESGLPTERIVLEAPRRGITGGWQDVFVSTRPSG